MEKERQRICVAENKDEDEIMSEAAREAEENRLEKLRKAADVKKERWKDRIENEASERTKELRNQFALKSI